ncbi:aldehyde dehydrogenase family protein [Aeromicrobium sp. Leaf245]|uniref:aldehyde dehydrogenase family protein n=1 Tax=Aeromicrobium sp. Leaf245 TaxID=1736306 RepID=UPI0006F2AF84|nr:aldehyde dehydrogenase family protein [Aeromicrobium sp. Leaf245]KQO42021.1 aldehyde dehydrogenase [Aeromicrobium sp. Leaf245]
MARLSVAKTYKLYIGGAFPRSESGRTYQVHDQKGSLMANAALASRKDARNAVVAARSGFSKWAGATPYNRGQVLYRVAEMLEARRTELVDLIVQSRGATAAQARAEVDASIDRVVHFAGWTDKLPAVFGGANAVSGPYFSYSAPEPTGVVAIAASPTSALLPLVAAVLPVLAGGNSVVVVASEADPTVAVTFAEVLATSDVPAGVVNVLTGRAAEMMPWLASHADVNGLDLTGMAADDRVELERSASGTVKRVYSPRREPDFTAAPGTARLRAFLEIKTVWHPVGAVSLAGGSAY